MEINYQHPYLVRPDDFKLLKKYLAQIGGIVGLGFGIGIGCSILLSKIWPNIFKTRF